MSTVNLQDIAKAADRIREVVTQTPLVLAHSISKLIGVPVYLKCENLQVTGSFKARGASNFVLSLMEQVANSELQGTEAIVTAAGAGREPAARGDVRGVITASSGNHGQAVAYAANKVGLPCTVVVPKDVISVKEEAIRGYGAAVERCGVTSSARIARAEQLSAEMGLVFVPPYDHPDIVAGQGTAGLEIVQRLPDVTEVYVPIGGGGLISGVATAVKESAMLHTGSRVTGNEVSSVRVIGVEPELANDTYLSLAQGEIVDIGPNTTIADGLRTSHPGSFTFPIVSKYVDEINLVSEAEIVAAMKELFLAKLVVEPSGCTTVAAVLRAHLAGHRFTGPVVCVLSGGNVAPETFASVLD